MDDLRKLAWAANRFPDAVVVDDHDGVIEFVNPAFETITGFPRIEAVGCSLAILSSGMREIEFSRDVLPMLLAGNQFRDVLANRTRSGGIVYAEWGIGSVRNGEGRVTHVIATGRDMTDHVRTTEGLKRALEHVGMTGLPNRSLFFDRLSQILKHSARCGGALALGMIDVDRFKAINDRFGHFAGDALLRVVVLRLQHACATSTQWRASEGTSSG